MSNSTTPTAKELIEEANEKDLGLGKAQGCILRTHVECGDREKDQKMVDTLLHAIYHTTGRYLTPEHLIWAKKAQNAKI